MISSFSVQTCLDYLLPAIVVYDDARTCLCCLIVFLILIGLCICCYCLFLRSSCRTIENSSDQDANKQASNNQASDQDLRRELIQQQLIILLHARKCQRREQQQQQMGNGELNSDGKRSWPCTLPHCSTMKDVLNHMSTCKAGKECKTVHCPSSRQILSHWKNCLRPDCPVCEPLKTANTAKTNTISNQAQTFDFVQIADQDNQTLAGYLSCSNEPQAASAAVAGNQGVLPVKTVKEWHNLCNDELRMHQVEKMVNSMFSTPNQTAVQDKRCANLLIYAKRVEADLFELASSLEEYYRLIDEKIDSVKKDLGQVRQARMNRQQQLNNSQSAHTDHAPTAVARVKEWHHACNDELRMHLVQKFLYAIFPCPDMAAVQDRRMANLVAYAKMVEANLFTLANSREEYYRLLAVKIYKILKELEEKRQKRKDQQQQQQSKNEQSTSQNLQVPTEADVLKHLRQDDQQPSCVPGKMHDLEIPKE